VRVRFLGVDYFWCELRISLGAILGTADRIWFFVVRRHSLTYAKCARGDEGRGGTAGGGVRVRGFSVLLSFFKFLVFTTFLNFSLVRL